jgi:uncharacterized protein
MASKVDSKVLITGMVIVGVLVFALIIANSFGSPSSDNTISSNGQATIKVVPDFVSVYFNVQITNATASGASDKNSEIVSKMKSSLIALGLKNDEIQTQGFSVYPDYEWTGNTQRLKGYTASHSIVVKIPVADKDKIGSVIDAGVDSGAGISYINYELSQESQNMYKAEAIKSATQDATNKAEALAEGAGKKLGKLVSVSTSDFGYVPWLAYGKAETDTVSSGAEIATTITPSEQEISAQVTAVYKIR